MVLIPFLVVTVQALARLESIHFQSDQTRMPPAGLIPILQSIITDSLGMSPAVY